MGERRKVLQSIVTVGIFLLVGRAVGAAREIVLAANFGTSETIDAYLFSLNFANWPISVWLSALTVVAVPLMVRASKVSPADLRQFAFELSAVALFAGSALSVLFWLGIPIVASMFGLPISATRLVGEMAGPMSLLLPVGLLIGTFSVRLLAAQRHVNTLLEGIPAFVVAGTVVALSDLGPSVVVWGTVIGFVAQASALFFFFPGAPSGTALRIQLRSALWKPFLLSFGLVALGQLIAGSTGVIDQLMVGGLGVGAIAILGYANRILALVLGLGATAVSRAMLPTFSAHNVDDKEGFRRSAQFWMKLLFAFGIVCALVGWMLAPWAVRILLERGRFTAEDTAAVSAVLQFGLLQLPFYFPGIVAVQVLAADGRFNRITQVGLINFVVKVAANLFFVDRFGVAGVMMASGVTYAVALPILVAFALKEKSARQLPSDASSGQREGIGH